MVKRICPLRPQNPIDDEDAAAEAVFAGWDNIEDADILRDPGSSVIGSVDETDEVSAADGGSTQVPIGVPEPPTPSAAEGPRDNLAHVTDRS